MGAYSMTFDWDEATAFADKVKRMREARNIGAGIQSIVKKGQSIAKLQSM